jgi:hypothetical protein
LLVNTHHPEVVVLGGGVIEALADDMMGKIVAAARDYAKPGVLDGVEILASKVGELAAITGGLFCSKTHIRLPMIASPICGLILGFALMTLLGRR